MTTNKWHGFISMPFIYVLSHFPLYYINVRQDDLDKKLQKRKYTI